MTLIVCVDDTLGMAFGGRRQSRDRALCEDVIKLAAGKTIRMDPRSAKLFEGLGGAIAASEDFTRTGGTEDLCFVEFEPVGNCPINTVHTHMISIISTPSKCKF